MNSQIQYAMLKQLLMPFFLFACLLVFHSQAKAQEKPPRPILVTVDVAAQLNFGKFIPIGTNAETVTVDSDGMRSCSIGIIPVSSYFSAARYIVDAEPGTLITIAPIPPATLSGSNRGTLSLELGKPSIESPFVTTNKYTDVFFGGTLTVGSLMANPPGFYSGTFQITFIQE